MLLPIALAGCACFWVYTELYANRDIPLAYQSYLAAKDIYVCSGESVLLSWSSHRKLTQAWIAPDVGTVDPNGKTVVQPQRTTTYTITAEGGECRARSSTTVHLVEPGTRVELQATEVYDATTDAYYWHVETKEQILSPHIIVNSVQAGKETDEVGPWTVSKTDPNGVVHDLAIPEDRAASPAERFSIIGSWDFWPEKNYRGTATFILRVECQQ